ALHYPAIRRAGPGPGQVPSHARGSCKTGHGGGVRLLGGRREPARDRRALLPGGATRRGPGGLAGIAPGARARASPARARERPLAELPAHPRVRVPRGGGAGQPQGAPPGGRDRGRREPALRIRPAPGNGCPTLPRLLRERHVRCHGRPCRCLRRGAGRFRFPLARSQDVSMTRSKSPSPFRLALTALVGALGIGSLLATGGSGSGGSSGEDTGPGGQPAAPTWAKSFGGPARDYAAAGAARPGGGYVVAGTWNQRGAGLGRIGEPEPLGVESDAWVIALDAFGDVEWQRTYGVRSARAVGEYVSLFEIAAEPDRDGDGSGDGAWVAGYASDVPTVQYFEPGRDLLVARIDAADRLAWTRRHDAGPLTSEDYFYGDEGTSETVLDIDVPADGGLLVAAIAAATVNRNGQATLVQRLWVVRLGPSGDRLWSTFLGNDDDRQPLALPGLVRALPGGGAVAAFDAKGRDGDQRVVVARLDAAP